MKNTRKKLLTAITLLSITLLGSGCAPKNANGTYRNTYSYHPYNNRNQMTHIYSTNEINKHFTEERRYSRPINRYNMPSTAISNNIETVAKSLLGTDYQYGANGPYQYDCSSFTKFVFSRQGINLPRVSKDQANIGQFIRVSQLQKGDLIFFDSKNSSKVSHVGIYLGQGNFIHASSAKDKVTISNLSSNYYSKHFKWGRRVTNMSYASR